MRGAAEAYLSRKCYTVCGFVLERKKRNNNIHNKKRGNQYCVCLLYFALGVLASLPVRRSLHITPSQQEVLLEVCLWTQMLLNMFVFDIFYFIILIRIFRLFSSFVCNLAIPPSTKYKFKLWTCQRCRAVGQANEEAKYWRTALQNQ